MANKKANQWCQAALPGNFVRVSKDTAAIQQFLRKQLPEPMNQQVSVVNITDESIVIAVADPQISNYLRLYMAEIQQQIQETFNLKQVLKIKTIPFSVLKSDHLLPASKKPLKVKPETVQALKRGADWIEDEGLKQALKSLASSLKKSS
ncbi:MAG: hypothetical protein ACI9CO_000424 [Candidatus Azotimanducaceae bacterium]|jgi:hypothetical protein